MSIDFCDERLGSQVICCQVSCDGYDVSNLISSDQSLKKKGFRAEYYIKPPVDLVFTFPVTIDLRAIVLDLKSGQHEVSGLMVSTCSTDDGKDQVKMINHKIGRYESLNKSKVIIVNSSYQINGMMRKKGFHMDPCKPEDDVEMIYVPRIVNQGCCNVKKIEIKLTRTKRSSIVGLSSVKILGQPSALSRKAFQDIHLRSAVEDVLNKALTSRPAKQIVTRLSLYGSSGIDGDSNVVTSKPESKDNCQVKRKHDDDDNIPADFLDALTQEMMEFPVTLPSGQTIDKSTLDKYQENEAKWGRTASDPFTTKPFSRDRQPIPNTALKARIDRYCLEKVFKKVPDWFAR